MTDKPQDLMTHEQFLDMVVPDSEMGVTYRNLVVALEAYERDLTKRDEALRLAREAIIEAQTDYHSISVLLARVLAAIDAGMEHNRICTYPNCNCTDSPHGACIAREKACPHNHAAENTITLEQLDALAALEAAWKTASVHEHERAASVYNYALRNAAPVFISAARRDEEWTLLFGHDINAAHGDLIATKSEAALYEAQFRDAIARAEKAEREMSEELARRKLLVKTTMCYFDCARQAQAKLADARATVETLQRERDEARAESARTDEILAGRSQTWFDQLDAALADNAVLRALVADLRASVVNDAEVHSSSGDVFGDLDVAPDPRSHHEGHRPMTDETAALVARMKEAARKATPGPWFQTGAPWYHDGSGVVAGSPDGNIAPMVADTAPFSFERTDYEGPFKLGDSEDDAAHIAASNPASVLALIAAYEAEKERADRAERFCARASTAAGEHGFVCADAVSLRGELASARALIARAVEAIEQARTFADLQRRHRATDCACASCRRENDYVDSLAALAADLRNVGKSVADT